MRSNEWYGEPPEIVCSGNIQRMIQPVRVLTVVEVEKTGAVANAPRSVVRVLVLGDPYLRRTEAGGSIGVL